MTARNSRKRRLIMSRFLPFIVAGIIVQAGYSGPVV
jgi:hypothetical protein